MNAKWIVDKCFRDLKSGGSVIIIEYFSFTHVWYARAMCQFVWMWMSVCVCLSLSLSHSLSVGRVRHEYHTVQLNWASNWTYYIGVYSYKMDIFHVYFFFCLLLLRLHVLSIPLSSPVHHSNQSSILSLHRPLISAISICIITHLKQPYNSVYLDAYQHTHKYTITLAMCSMHLQPTHTHTCITHTV